MPSLLLLLSVLTIVGAQDFFLDDSELYEALRSYELTLEGTQGFIAAIDELAELAAASPDSTAGLPAIDGQHALTLETIDAQIEQAPGIAAVLARHGLGGRDLLLLPVAFVQAATLVDAPPHVMADTTPFEQRMNLSNVSFLKEHRELLPAMEQAWERWGTLFRR